MSPYPKRRRSPGGLKAIPTVICHGCGRPLPRLLGQVIPESLVVEWSDLMLTEKQLLAGVMLDHVRGNPFSTWDPQRAAEMAGLKYRQVQNALRRLVPCRWVARLSRGRYRLTERTVEIVRPMITSGRMTVTKLRDAQVPQEKP